MKKFILVYALCMLGCGNPIGVTNSSLQDVSPDLIKAEVSTIGEDKSPVEEVTDPVTQETVQIIQESSEVEGDKELGAIPHELPVEHSILGNLKKEDKEETVVAVSQVIYKAEEKDEASEKKTEEFKHTEETKEIGHEETKQPEQNKEEVSGSKVAESAQVEVEKEVKESSEKNSIAEKEVEPSVLPADLIDEDTKAELDKVTYGEEASDVTMVTHKKEKDKLESYTIYSQSSKDSKWRKEFDVEVENGKVKTISSHNNHKIEQFSDELQEIVSLEGKFKEKLSSKDVDDSKESTVSQFVKNKKSKKTTKIKNKKFGKKSKKKEKSRRGDRD